MIYFNFCLKDERSYDKLWQILKEHGAFESGVSPKRVMTDFEMALANSAAKHIPWATVR
jgi:hypothetical protein